MVEEADGGGQFTAVVLRPHAALERERMWERPRHCAGQLMEPAREGA